MVTAKRAKVPTMTDFLYLMLPLMSLSKIWYDFSPIFSLMPFFFSLARSSFDFTRMNL